LETWSIFTVNVLVLETWSLFTDSVTIANMVTVYS
jgi:predicted ribosomally synthesized peptide with SipW-like signal peptide